MWQKNSSKSERKGLQGGTEMCCVRFRKGDTDKKIGHRAEDVFSGSNQDG